MPLKLNVGLSRKVGEANYGSRGASVNVEMELESSLVGEPAKLQERIRQIFGIVRTSLAEELNGNGHSLSQRLRQGHQRRTAAMSSTGNGGGRDGGAADQHFSGRHPVPGQGPAPIAKSKGLNLTRLLQGRYQVDRPEDLGIKQASQLIGKNFVFTPEGGGVDVKEVFQKARSHAENHEVQQREAWHQLLALDGWEIKTSLLTMDLARGTRSIFRGIAPAEQKDVEVEWHGRTIKGRVYMRDLLDAASKTPPLCNQSIRRTPTTILPSSSATGPAATR